MPRIRNEQLEELARDLPEVLDWQYSTAMNHLRTLHTIRVLGKHRIGSTVRYYPLKN